MNMLEREILICKAMKETPDNTLIHCLGLLFGGEPVNDYWIQLDMFDFLFYYGEPTWGNMREWAKKMELEAGLAEAYWRGKGQDLRKLKVPDKTGLRQTEEEEETEDGSG